MSSKVRPPQKLISFSNNKADLDRISQDMKEGGWAIISLMQNGKYYVGVMEKMQYIKTTPTDEDATIYIPPRKKIKISY
jgi:hypothetical protein